jgi:hypothetical protein
MPFSASWCSETNDFLMQNIWVESEPIINPHNMRVCNSSCTLVCFTVCTTIVQFFAHGLSCHRAVQLIRFLRYSCFNVFLGVSSQNGLATKVEKSRKQMKERKNRAKKIRGVKKVLFLCHHVRCYVYPLCNLQNDELLFCSKFTYYVVAHQEWCSPSALISRSSYTLNVSQFCKQIVLICDVKTNRRHLHWHLLLFTK